MTAHRLVLTLATVTVACAYYNGLYNANRLASEARRAEKEGRRGDARSLWMQAAVRAESVAARYPDSKYWDDALLMSGRAQQRVGECALAIPLLGRVVASSDDADVVAEARILLAECQLAERQFDAVLEVVEPLLHRDDNRYAQRARTARGRASLALGEPGAAVRDLSPPENAQARFDLVAALLRAGWTDRARVELQIAADAPYDNERWPELLHRLAAHDPGGASAFVDRWVDDPSVSRNARVTLLTEDAERWSRRGSDDIAMDRLLEALEVADDPELLTSVKYRLALLRLRRTNAVEQIEPLVSEFRDVGAIPGEGEVDGHVYADVLAAVVYALDKQEGGGLLLFREAEAVRDRLGEKKLAALLFRTVAKSFPESALSPKALLALADLEPHLNDSILAVLETQYTDSPYTDLALGGVGAGFTALEDSLQRALDALAREKPRP